MADAVDKGIDKIDNMDDSSKVKSFIDKTLKTMDNIEDFADEKVESIIDKFKNKHN